MHLDQVVVGTREAIHELFGGRCFHCPMLDAHARGVCVSELEGGELRGQVLMVVNGKLGEAQPFRPTILFFSTEETQILLHFLVHDFGLTICLQVMHSRELGSDAESLAEVCHDLQSKLWTAIRDDGAREAMILPDVE